LLLIRRSRVIDVLMMTNAVAPDKLGGLERIVRELAAELVKRDSHVTVLAKQVNAGDPRDEVGDDGVVVQRYQLASRSSQLFALTYPFHTARAVRSSVRRAGNAVLHAHFPVPALALALARQPYIYSFHAPVYRELLLERHTRYPLARPLQPAAVEGLRRAERLVVRRATRIIVLSEYARSELHRLDPRAAERATLIAGGIQSDRFSPGQGWRDEWSAAAEPLIFTARRLTPRTGVLELLRAMRTIVRSLPRARLAIAGTGSSESLLRGEVARLGLADSVRFVGRISDTDLVNSYRAADLVIMPSQALEGFGLTTAEALACGTPVVGTPIGATPELLTSIDPALVAADATPAGIAMAVISLLADPDRVAAIRLGLRKAGSHALSWQTVTPRYLEEYMRFSASRPGV
jgi:glycosyltransferase involved in cell wall biosynthesis